MLAAIVFVATSGCIWNQLPPGFGLSGVTAFRRFTEWTEARVWAKLLISGAVTQRPTTLARPSPGNKAGVSPHAQAPSRAVLGPWKGAQW